MGIALPPSHGKKRIALQLAPAAVRTLEPPPLLGACADAVPAAWRATIEAIVELCVRVGVEVRAFGAVAWSALTGLDYFSPSSDLDLLFPLTPQTCVQALLDGLALIESGASMLLDGEIIRADQGGAVHWRELSAGSDEVLIKSIAGVAIGRRDAFLACDDHHHHKETKDWLAAS
jgi:phosphoribosyl-dephospho-CoA transferase